MLNHIVALKTEKNNDDLEIWQWLQELVTCLGEHGMSSEEHGMSSEENSIENEVEEMLQMPWR